jgi:hypothetical protein
MPGRASSYLFRRVGAGRVPAEPRRPDHCVEVGELLPCSHHYWSSIDPLKRIGAAAFDVKGSLLMPRVWRLDDSVTAVV